MNFLRYVVSVIFLFPWEWMTTRNPRLFLVGFPSFASLIGVGVLVTIAEKQDSSDMLPRYIKTADKAFANEEYEAAEVLYRKAASLDPSKPAPKFGMARTAEVQGAIGRAWRLIEGIATVDKPGYAPGHDWIARKLIEQAERLNGLKMQLLVERQTLVRKDKESGTVSQKQLAENESRLLENEERLNQTNSALKQHLIYTVQQRPQNIFAHANLAMRYLADEEIEKAKEHLAIGATYTPGLMLAYARLQIDTGDVEQGKLTAKNAAAFFKKMAIRDPDNRAVRLQWADCEALRGDAETVVKILRDGIERTQDPSFTRALAQFYVNQAKMVASRSDSKDKAVIYGKQLEFIQQALTVDPTNSSGLQTLAALATSEEGEDSEAAQEMLRQVLADGRATAVVHLVIGTSAIKKDDFELAELHLKQAQKLNSRIPAVLNNLAWVLSRRSPPQKDEAIKLLDNAIVLLPSHPEIRETRGQLLAEQEKWEDAITDLEYALNYYKDRPKIHDTLGKCYGELGDAEMSRIHKKKAVALQEKGAKKTAEQEGDA